MKKITFGFTVETAQHETYGGVIHISMDDHGVDSTVVISPHEVDTLIQQLQEAKAELLHSKPKEGSNHHQSRN